MNYLFPEALQAIRDNDTRLLHELIDSGIDVNSIYAGDATLLQYAMMQDSLFAFEILLFLGADPELEVNGSSPLNIAIDSEITSSTDNHWNFGRFKGDKCQPNPVFSSRLLYYGADPDKADSSGDIPRDEANKRGHLSFSLPTNSHNIMYSE